MKLTTAEYGFPQLWRLRYAYREMLEWHLIRVSLGVLGAGVLLLTVLGPIGIEDGFGPMHRFAFVTLCSVFCWPLCHALSSAILYLARSRQPLEILLACAAGELFMAVPCGAVVYALFGLFQPHEAADFTLLELYLNTAVLILACRSIIHYVACQAVDPRRAETAGQETVAPMQDLAETPGPAAGPVVEAESRQRLFERLPTMVGRDIIYLVPVRKVGISGIGAGGKRPRSISQEAVRRTKNSSRPLRASTDRSLPRPRGSVAAAGPPVASRRARSGAGCCNRSGAMADSGVRPAWDAGEPGASGCGRTPPIGRRP